MRLVLVLPVIILSANGAAADGNYENGKKLAKDWECIHCHGLTGNQRMDAIEPAVPMLAGQPASYLAKTMRDYKTGKRIDDHKNTKMNARIKPLSEQDIDDLAAYYSAQKRY